jgi:hypothetical protein
MLSLTKRQTISLFILGFLLLSLPPAIYLAQQKILKKRAEIVQPAIIVDCQDFLGPLPAFWQGLAQGGEEKEPMLNDVTKEISALKPKYIRLDHLFDFYEVVYRKKDGTLGFNWQVLDDRVQDILKTGALPFFSLSYMPKALASGNEISPPQDYSEWELLVQKTIEHYSGKSNLNLLNVYYEVWNEPDSFGRWTIGGSKDYRNLYFWAVSGSQKAQNVNDFKIGGPAISSLNPTFMAAFLDYIGKNNLRLDFVSWHVYSFAPEKMAQESKLLDNLLALYPNLLGAQKIVSEWGIEAAKSYRHATNVSAAHTAATISCAARTIDLALAFEVKDNLYDTGYGWGIITHELAGKKIKPRYQALWLLNFLKDTQVPTLGEGVNVYALATKDQEESISLLISNYSLFKQATKTVVPIIFNRLFNGVYQLKSYLLDSGIEIKAGSSKTLTVQGGVVSDSIFMPKDSVAILELRRIAPFVSYTPNGRFGYPGDHAALLTKETKIIIYPLNNRITAALGTIEMWLKPSWSKTTSEEKTIFEASMTNNTRFLAKKLLGNNLEFGFFEGTGSAKTVAVNVSELRENQWHHLAFIWDNTQGKNSFLKIFVNGKLKGTSLGGWKSPIGKTFYLGSKEEGIQKIDGVIDELRISNLPLYKANFTPPFSPLIPEESTIILQHFDGFSNP